MIECAIVDDRDHVADYAGSVTHGFAAFPWTSGPPGSALPLSVFEVAGAYVTAGYLPIDPVRRLLFVNQSYDNLATVAALPTLTRGATFGFVPGDVRTLTGQVVVIGGPFESNYFHGLLNWFSRFTLLERLAPAIHADPEMRFMVDVRARAEPFVSILAALGIAPERILWCDHAANHRIERAVLVSFIHEGLICPELFALHVAAIRRVLGIATPAAPWKRIWISREHLPEARRRIANIDAFADVLDRLGFERIVLERLSFADQVRLFSDAAIVAGSHGAGFANMVFCAPGTRLVIVEKEFTRFLGIVGLFAHLAAISKLECEIVPATSIRTEGIDYSVFINGHFADAIVDPALIADALERAVAADRDRTDRRPPASD